MPAKPPAKSRRCSSGARGHISSPRCIIPARLTVSPSGSRGIFSASQALARRRNDSTSSRSAGPTAVACSVIPDPYSDAEDVCQAAAVLTGCPEHCPVHRRAPKIEVDIVLPGDADTAVHLHAVLDDVGRALPDIGLRHAGQFVSLLSPPRRGMSRG